MPAPHDGELADLLNPDQLDAVVHADGPLLVVAGAGSGKTRVLTHRIAHLISEHGVSPFAILAITFTNKAADEMRQRVEALVGPVARKMWVSTFHSACVRILRRDAGRLGYPSSFSIYDQADAQRLTGYVIRDLGLDPKKFTSKGIHAAVSAAKNDLVSPAQYTERVTNIFERTHRRHLPGVPGPAGEGRRHGLRRPAHRHRPPLPHLPGRARALPAALRAHPGRRVPGHQPGPERAGAAARGRAPQRHRRRRQRPVPAPGHDGRDAGRCPCRSRRCGRATSCSGPAGAPRPRPVVSRWWCLADTKGSSSTFGPVASTHCAGTPGHLVPARLAVGPSGWQLV